MVVNAGPFHEIRQQHDGYDLGFFCRQSLVTHLERDLEELVTLTRQGLAFFGDKFGIPFPQERYDQVFVPNLGGAMENWGCVTYGDSQLFRTPPSHNQRAVRAEFVLHEMAHMWFGDLVTMQWWDDLWLNEAFASWASNWALSRATEFTDQWASFLALYKRPAYEMDMGPGRHSIRGEVADVNGAMANFDAITYVKGQSVLHQLMAYIGEDAFVEGLRAYFRDHAFGNTVLDDLMSAYAAAAGRDLSDWTAAWLDRSGTDILALDGSTVRAESPDDQAPRPHRIDIASFAVEAGTLRKVGVTSTELTGETTEVDLPAGDLRMLNAEDHTFAAVRPDARSLELMLEHLGDFPEALSRALVVGTITQLLLLGELDPRAGATAISRALHSERNPALVEPFLSVGHHVADRWARPSESPALRSALADAAVVLAGDPGNRQPALRTLAANATTDKHWAVLEEAAEASEDSDLAWRMAIRHAELGQRDDDAVDRLLERDADPDAGIKRLKVLAASPDQESKEAVWRAFFVDYAVPASRDTLELGSIFWRPEQAELLAPYTHRYLEVLPSLKGGLLNQGVVIRAMYPHAVGDASFLEAAIAASEDDSISLYARNQLRAQSFVLGRLHQARELCSRPGTTHAGSTSLVVVDVDAAQPLLVDRDPELSLPVDRRTDQPGEERVRPRRTRLELGVCLRRDVVGVHVCGELDELHQAEVRVDAREDQSGGLEVGAVGVVELVAVAVALLDPVDAVGLRHDAARRQHGRLQAQAHGAAEVARALDELLLLLDRGDDRRLDVRLELGRAGTLDAGDVAGVLDHHALQAQAQAERGDAVGAGVGQRAELALEAADAEAARDAAPRRRRAGAWRHPAGSRTRPRRSSAGAPSPRVRSHRHAAPRRPRGRRRAGRCTCRPARR